MTSRAVCAVLSPAKTSSLNILRLRIKARFSSLSSSSSSSLSRRVGGGEWRPTSMSTFAGSVLPIFELSNRASLRRFVSRGKKINNLSFFLLLSQMV